MDQDITVVVAGNLQETLPSGWLRDRDLITIYCDLDAKDISRTVEGLDNYDYVLLLPATSYGIKMCSVVRRMHCDVPIVLVGESKDRETLLYSAQLGCMDFISKEDEMFAVKKRLSVYIKLYSMSQRLQEAEKRI